MLDVVAGHEHLGAAGKLDAAGHVRRAEVELRPVAGEERRVTAALFLGQDVDLGLELRVRRDRAGLARAPGRARCRPSRRRGAGRRRCRRPGPRRAILLNISTPVTIGLARSRVRPTISTSSPTLTMPRSMRPVTTVPRPLIENTSSIGIRKGLSMSRVGLGDVAVERVHQLVDGTCRPRRPCRRTLDAP